MRNPFSLPRRRPNQPEPRSVYTFLSTTASSTGEAPAGTTYVLNSTVMNRKNKIRYTIATNDKKTDVTDRDGNFVARIEWDHRYPRIQYLEGNSPMKCKKWMPYDAARL